MEILRLPLILNSEKTSANQLEPAYIFKDVSLVCEEKTKFKLKKNTSVDLGGKFLSGLLHRWSPAWCIGINLNQFRRLHVLNLVPITFCKKAPFCN